MALAAKLQLLVLRAAAQLLIDCGTLVLLPHAPPRLLSSSRVWGWDSFE